MGLIRSYPLRWRPRGVSDTLDAGAFDGAMSILANLIPDPSTDRSWICRPAAVQLSAFPGLSAPTFQSGMLVVGDIMYGLIATSFIPGFDLPFAYNIQTNTFLTVTGITSGNVPAFAAASGDWTPPILAQVGPRIIVTHPGFPGAATKFGWFDISGLNSTSIQGQTHGTTTIDNFSGNALQAGWQPGNTITGTNIPAGTILVSIAANGLSAVISQPASGSGSAIVFTVQGGTRTQPLWGAGDCNINNLPSTPVGVAQFNGRAYFACGTDGLVFTDSGFPCNRTFANLALTPSNGLPITAVAQLMLSAPITGGVVQSLIAFQNNVAMQQINGDPATSNLSMNLLPVATGTLAPLSVTPCSMGLAFISPEGMRFIRPDGSVTDPVGDHGTGVTVPFINAQNPSRICGAANADTIRFTVKRSDVAANPTQEWWFDISRKIWSGPHTFPASLIQAWRGTFVVSATGINAKLWQSDVVVSSASLFVENGAQLSWSWSTSLLPDDPEMMMVSITESAIMLSTGLPGINANAFDDRGNLQASAQLPGLTGSAVFDSAVFDVDVFDGGTSPYRQYALLWNQPIVFKQGTVNLTGNSNPQTRIGGLSLRYQRLGYMLQVP